MSNTLIEKQILAQLNKLTDEQQKQVLDFTRFLATTKRDGVPGKELLRFAGTITPEDAKLMLEAIEEDCGRTDLNEW